MMNEWSDRAPSAKKRPWVDGVVIAIVALATLAMLAQVAMFAASFI